ncbi:MAG: hypothetical protein IJ229_09710 [Clostridia bacterium]|nr:hypothetical protein [Clostridia bacterium]
MLPTNAVNVAESSLLQKAKECAEFLRLILPATGQHPGHVRDSRWRVWEEAVKTDGAFLYDGDAAQVYEECKGAELNALTSDQLRACISHLLQMMAISQEPYECLTNGELLSYLDQWINLTEGTNG